MLPLSVNRGTELANKLIERSLESGWAPVLSSFFHRNNGKEILQNLIQDVLTNRRFTPTLSKLFNCLHYCPLTSVRVVILGAKPYAGLDTYTGIPFSRNLLSGTIRLPPLLRHMLAGLPGTEKLPVYKQADLTRWSKQGVLILPEGFTTPLLDTTKSHRELWSPLMNQLLDTLNIQKTPIKFLLLGEEGLYYEDLIASHHQIYKTCQPAESLKKKEKYWPGYHLLAQINLHLYEETGTDIDW